MRKYYIFKKVIKSKTAAHTSVYSSAIIVKKWFCRISVNFSQRTCLAIKSKSSFWMSLWVYFNLVRLSVEMMAGSLLPSSMRSWVKLSFPGLPWMAIPCLARNLRQRMISSKCLRSFRFVSRIFLFVISATSPQFGTIVSMAAAALWQFVFWCSSKHFGAFFQELKPTLMYACSLFLSLDKFCFLLWFEQ